MKLIKRYANRKLYDTEDKRYVSLTDIRDLIRSGVDLKVVDNESSEDITTVTLSQIIYEQEKKKEGILPPSVLTSLIQAGSTTAVDAVKKVVQTGLTAATKLQDDVEKTVKRFLRTGDLTECEAEELQRELENEGDGAGEIGRRLEERVQEAVRQSGVVSKDDLERLANLVRQLERKVDGLLEEKRSEAVGP